MSYPAGFEARPFYPDFAIHNGTAFTHAYRHSAIDASGNMGFAPGATTQFVKPISYQMRRGLNSDAGDLIITLLDHDNELVERDTGKCTIDIGERVFFYFGRSDPSVLDDRQLWFSGEIAETGVSRPGTNQQIVTVTCLGLMNRLAHIYVNFDFTESSPTDNKGKISELVKTLLTDSSIRPGDTDPDIGVANVESTDIRLPHLKRNYQTMGLVLSELANLSDSVYGIEQVISQSPNLFFFPRSSKRSNFLISNDIVNPSHITRDWAPQCLCYMRNQSYEYTDSQVDTGYGKIISIGVAYQHYPAPPEVAGDWWHYGGLGIQGYGFKPSQTQLTGISLHMEDPQLADPLFTLYSAGTPTTGFNPLGSQGSVIVAEQHPVETIGATRDWYKIFDFTDDPIPVSTDENYYVQMRITTPATRGAIKLSRGGGNWRYTQQTLDGAEVLNTSWGEAPIMRVEVIGKTHMLGHNISGGNRRKELLYQVQDRITLPEMTALQIGLLSSISRTVRKYTTITTSMTTDVPPLGKQVRLIDRFNGLDTHLDIMGYTVSASVQDESNLAPVSMEWTLEKRL